MFGAQWILPLLWMLSGSEPHRASQSQGESTRDGQARIEERPLWLVVFAGQSGNANTEDVGAVIQAHLASHPLEVESVSINASVIDLSTILELSPQLPMAKRAKVVWWIDFSEADHIDTYLMVVETGKLYERELTRNSNRIAISNEILGNIASTAASAWLSGGQLDEMRAISDQEIEQARKLAEQRKQDANLNRTSTKSEEQEALQNLENSSQGLPLDHSENPRTKSQTVPENQRRKQEWWQLAATAAYYGGTFSDNIPWQHGVAIGLAWKPLDRLKLGVQYTGIFPSRVEDRWLTIHLHRYPLWFMGEYVRSVSRDWYFQIGGLISVDYIYRQVRRQEPSLPIRPSRGRVFLGIGSRFGVKYWTKKRLSLGLFLGVEGLVRRSRYLVKIPEDRVLVAPHAARAFLHLEMSFGGLKRLNSSDSVRADVPK